MYTWFGRSPKGTLNLSVKILLHPSPNFTGGGSKNAKFGHDFRPRLTTLKFELLSFRNEVLRV